MYRDGTGELVYYSDDGAWVFELTGSSVYGASRGGVAPPACTAAGEGAQTASHRERLGYVRV